MIRLVGPDDIEAYIAHLKINLSESGREGTPIFTPYPANEPWDFNVRRPLILERWKKSLSEPGWERAWAKFEGDRIVGQIDLRTELLNSNQHRANLGMGIQRAYCGRGLGRALMEIALGWARAEPSLEYVDLCVFEENTPARALYRRLGFTQYGRLDDAFRIDGKRLADLQMTLKLR